MAYWKTDKTRRVDLGHGRIPYEPVKRVVCDTCADGGEVSFHPDACGEKTQDPPWKWAPVFGAPCHKCGKAS